MKSMDCRGLACPGPVIQVKKALEETPRGGSISIELDSEASRDNVRRFAESRGAQIQTLEGIDGCIRLIITTPPDVETPFDRLGAGGQILDAGRKPPVVLITAETIGSGNEKLGRILMEGFINTLLEQDQAPDRILFLNTGVNYTVQGSAVLKTLEKLTDRGCEILVCGTCLDFFGLKDKLAIGTVSNMYDIQGALLNASSVIKA